jgi:hypothetical protein
VRGFGGTPAAGPDAPDGWSTTAHTHSRSAAERYRFAGDQVDTAAPVNGTVPAPGDVVYLGIDLEAAGLFAGTHGKDEWQPE